MAKRSKVSTQRRTVDAILKDLRKREAGEQSLPATLFVDMLGFASVTEFSSFTHSMRPYPRDVLKPYGMKQLPWSDRYDSAFDVYKAFQRIMRTTTLEAHRRRKASTPLLTIVFSDAIYVTFDSMAELVSFATRAMLRCYIAALPVRMGIGAGRVTRLRFTSETFPTNDTILSAAFMGPGIVSAYKAEGSLKGMRIALAPGASEMFKREGLEHRLLPIPGAVWPQPRFEVNYLYPEQKSIMHASLASVRVEAMKCAAPKAAQGHYSETLKAIGRMHAQEKARRAQVRLANMAKWQAAQAHASKARTP